MLVQKIHTCPVERGQSASTLWARKLKKCKARISYDKKLCFLYLEPFVPHYYSGNEVQHYGFDSGSSFKFVFIFQVTFACTCIIFHFSVNFWSILHLFSNLGHLLIAIIFSDFINFWFGRTTLIWSFL